MTRRASFNVVDSQFILLFFQPEITLNREKNKGCAKEEEKKKN